MTTAAAIVFVTLVLRIDMKTDRITVSRSGMRKRALFLLIALLMTGRLAFAREIAVEEAVYERYCGTWSNDDFLLDLRFEEDTMTGRLAQYGESDDIVVWEFYHCQYEPESDILWCDGCIHYRERIDFVTFERTEEDWRLTDLSDIYFAFGDDENTIIGYGIEDISEPLVLQRERVE